MMKFVKFANYVLHEITKSLQQSPFTFKTIQIMNKLNNYNKHQILFYTFT